jgi:DNA-binding NarL/FixJ family response regulator
LSGVQAARVIARLREPPRVLMLSMHDNEQYFFSALKLGASGYVLKSVVDEDLVEACRAAMRGEAFVYPGAMGALVRDYLDRLARGERVPETVLTPREDEVLKLIAEGRSSKEIARLLSISIKTVESHRANILARLGMSDRTQLTRYAIRAGLIEP